jgi:hypothetical protein
LFSKAQRKELCELAPDWLTPEQKDKFDKTINGINTPAFGVRLSERLDRDGVPLTEEERELLFGTLRSARNDVRTGERSNAHLTRDEILRGISVVSRALLLGIAARACAADERASGGFRRLPHIVGSNVNDLLLGDMRLDRGRGCRRIARSDRRVAIAAARRPVAHVGLGSGGRCWFQPASRRG